MDSGCGQSSHQHALDNGPNPGYVRQLKPKQRAEVKAVRKKRGVEASIKRERKLLER